MDKFDHCIQLLLSTDWEVGTGDGNGFKSVTAFYPAEASSSGSSGNWLDLLS